MGVEREASERSAAVSPAREGAVGPAPRGLPAAALASAVGNRAFAALARASAAPSTGRARGLEGLYETARVEDPQAPGWFKMRIFPPRPRPPAEPTTEERHPPAKAPGRRATPRRPAAPHPGGGGVPPGAIARMRDRLVAADRARQQLGSPDPGDFPYGKALELRRRLEGGAEPGEDAAPGR
jgi:hypothetical protein